MAGQACFRFWSVPKEEIEAGKDRVCFFELQLREGTALALKAASHCLQSRTPSGGLGRLSPTLLGAVQGLQQVFMARDVSLSLGAGSA